MKPTIGIIEKSKFDLSNYPEVIQSGFKEILHRNTPYMFINTFEKYTTGYPFDQVFNSNEDFETWLVHVPATISKLQAVSLMLQTGNYNEMITALEADETGAKNIV